MGFTLPQLNTCCCGCTLRTGTLILLFLALITGVLSVCSPLFPEPSSSVVPQMSPAFMVITGIISAILAGGGLYAVYTEIPGYLIPHLIWYLLQVVIYDITIILFEFSIGNIIGIIIGTLLVFYLWLVVFSYYRVLGGSASPNPA